MSKNQDADKPGAEGLKRPLKQRLSEPFEGGAAGGYLPSMKDLTLFGRRVSGGRTMGEGADMACQSVISKLAACQARSEGKAGACSREDDAVMECKGSFLCPAVAAQWLKCLDAKAKGAKVDCKSERSALSHCMDCNSTE